MPPTLNHLIPPAQPLPGAAHELPPDTPCAALLGVPFDHGVKLVGGRVGARRGPAALHQYLLKHLDLGEHPLPVMDLGEVEIVPEDVAATHERITAIIAELVRAGVTPILIGGGHDLTYAGVAGLAAGAAGAIGGINLDAHFDVREVVAGEISSGTPFRRVLTLLADRVAGRSFVEIGIQPKFQKPHREFLEGLGAKIHFIEEVRERGLEKVMNEAINVALDGTDAAFLSLDIDSISAAYAPGCSAPCQEGLTPEEVAAAVRSAATETRFRYFDITEINPEFDLEERTLAAATAVLRGILRGLCERSRSNAYRPPQ